MKPLLELKTKADVKVTIIRDMGQYVLNFNMPLRSIGLTPSEAQQISRVLKRSFVPDFSEKPKEAH